MPLQKLDVGEGWPGLATELTDDPVQDFADGAAAVEQPIDCREFGRPLGTETGLDHGFEG